jgi:phosphatidylglycerophosphatase A
MIGFHRLVSTWLGIGYIGKGSGTIAALFCAVCWWLICRNGSNSWIMLSVAIVVAGLGVWSAGRVEADWGKDSSRVVVDEVAGMCVSLLFLPAEPKYVLTAFVLFRFFDIAKPFFIRRLEELPGGWGVMADDILAGIYSNLLVQVIVVSKIY